MKTGKEKEEIKAAVGAKADREKNPIETMRNAGRIKPEWWRMGISILLTMVVLLQGMCQVTFAEDGGTSDTPTMEPKVMIQSYYFSKNTVYAGKEVAVHITLVNTSTTTAVCNMMVTAEIENEYMELKRYTDSIYIPYIAAGGTQEISWRFQTKASTPPGQYNFSLAMDYADKNGGSYNASAKVKVDVVQKTKIQFDPLVISSEAEIGDTIEAQVNAMNLGHEKVRNVRAKIKADGLTPKGTIYLGNIDAGEKGSGTAEVLVGGLVKSEEEYGETTGTVTFYYENENGKTVKIKKKFSMNIRPLAVKTETVEEDDTKQWWVIMGVIAGVVCIFAGYGIVRALKRHRKTTAYVA